MKKIYDLNEKEENEVRNLSLKKGIPYSEAFNIIRQGKLDRFF